MESNQIPQYANAINNSMGVLESAAAGAINTDTNTVVCFTAGAKGSIVKHISIMTDDTSDVDVILQEVNPSNVVVRFIVLCKGPALSGTNGVAPMVDALAGSGITLIGGQKDNQSKQFIQIAALNTIKASPLANMSGGGGAPVKYCYINVEGRDYE